MGGWPKRGQGQALTGDIGLAGFTFFFVLRHLSFASFALSTTEQGNTSTPPHTFTHLQPPPHPPCSRSFVDTYPHPLTHAPSGA